MKKWMPCVLAVLMVFSLTSCADSGESVPEQSQAPSASVDPLIMAEEVFNLAMQSLTEAQSRLQEKIPEAAELLESITTDDVSDPETINELEDSLGDAKAVLEITIPEMQSDLEAVQEQV